ncbi:MAG: ankyrin repeat domain-containing protein [Arenimonas sp.]|nr:ankyrin repeat domain-containing protein [Arenimonas sp.]
MVEFFILALQFAVFHGVLIELLKAYMHRKDWQLKPAIKSASMLVLFWGLLQSVLALLLLWPTQALQQTHSLNSVIALALIFGMVLFGMQRLWPNWASLQQNYLLGWPHLDPKGPAFGFWRTFAVALILLLLAIPAFLIAISWAFLPTEYSLWLIPYAILACVFHVISLKVPLPILQPLPETVQNSAALNTRITLDPDLLLLQAIQNGQVDQALQALENGANPHQLQSNHAKDQRSVMMMASTISDLRLLRTLISRGVDVNAFYSGLNPLLSATRDSWHGRSEAVTMLLTNGAQTQVADRDGNSPLHFAMRSTDPAVAALLLDAGAEKEAINKEGFTPLALACQAANWRLARYMLERKASVEPLLAVPVLIAAAGAEDDEIGIRLLHKYKAKIDVRDNQQRTPLMIAAQAGLIEVVKVLLELGAQINAQDEAGLTAYMLAAQSGEVAIVNELQASSKLNRAIVDLQGKTALDYALSKGCWNAVAIMDSSYPVPEHIQQSPDQKQPITSLQLLQQALAAGDIKTAESIMQAGMQLSQAEMSDLLYAYCQVQPRLALSWLLQQGGHLFCQNTAGVSVYQRLMQTNQNQGSVLYYFLANGQAISGAGSLAIYLESCLLNDFSRRFDEQLALYLLQQGACPFSSATETSAPPLTIAVRLGWLRLTKALLELGVDANSTDNGGMTALHFAAQLGRLSFIDELIKHGAVPEKRAISGQSALGLALIQGAQDCIAALTWVHWPLPGRRLRNSDLPSAVLAKDIVAVKKLLGLGIDVNGFDQKGSTALIHASGQGLMDMVQLLIKHGADSKIAAQGGATALWAAISQAQTEILAVLLNEGADANQLVGGFPPLNLACFSGSAEQASLLIEYGAQIETVDSQAQNALHACAVYLSSEKARLDSVILVDVLIRAGVAYQDPDSLGLTPLHLLCGASLQKAQTLKEGLILSALERLLQEPISIDCVDARGFTPLHHASARGFGQLIERLLKAGADKNRRDNLGRSAYDFAVMGGFSEVANRLQDKPERVDIASLLIKKDQA